MTEESKRITGSLFYPLIFLIIIWSVKIFELVSGIDLYFFGIFPKKASGLLGILFSPFIHGDFSHLISNSFPLIVLGWALFYFYRDVAFRVLIFSMLITGFWVWVMARPSYHIGASGIIYSLAAFLFTSGVIRKHPRLMALSLLVVFLYGGMIWGIFPLKERMSWESHLMGMISGGILAYFFRGHGPQRKVYSWELEEEPDDDDTGVDVSALDALTALEAQPGGQPQGNDVDVKNVRDVATGYTPDESIEIAYTYKRKQENVDPGLHSGQ